MSELKKGPWYSKPFVRRWAEFLLYRTGAYWRFAYYVALWILVLPPRRRWPGYEARFDTTHQTLSRTLMIFESLADLSCGRFYTMETHGARH